MIRIIYAKSLNNVIGIDNKLPWYLPSELEMFKIKTLNSTVVMGRKTFDSLPSYCKPLKDRNNVVITRDSKFKYKDVTVVTNPDKYFLDLVTKNLSNEIWVIGGLEIFNIAINYADEIHVTNIEKIVEGNVKAPIIKAKDFALVNTSKIYTDGHSGLNFYIDIFKRYQNC